MGLELHPVLVVLISSGTMARMSVTLITRTWTCPNFCCIRGQDIFKLFCTRISGFYDNMVAYAFSSAYTIAPHVNAAVVSDLESDNESNTDDVSAAKWYQPLNETPTPAPPLMPVPPPATNADAVVNLPVQKTPGFDLGASLIYINGNGSSETVVYKGAMPNDLHHTIRWKDDTKLNVHDFHLQIKHQPDLSNIPSTPLDYCKEVGRGITREEAEQLACPCILSPIQQELMDWHHHLYHLSFAKIFRLADYGLLPKRLLDCKGRLPLCIACQFGTAHWRPWRVKGKASGSIRCPEHIQPGDVSWWTKLCQPNLVWYHKCLDSSRIVKSGDAQHFVIT